jgi:hypothetical protein
VDKKARKREQVKIRWRERGREVVLEQDSREWKTEQGSMKGRGRGRERGNEGREEGGSE